MFILCLKLEMFIMTICVACTPISTWGARLSSYAMILLAWVLPFLAIPQPLTARVKAGGICLCLFGVCVVCSLFTSPGLVDLDLVVVVLSFFCCYASIVVSGRSYKRRDLQHILIIGKVLAMIYIAYAYLPFSFRYQALGGSQWKQFTLGLGNPNSTSIRIMFCIGLLLMDLEITKRWVMKCLDYLMIIALGGVLIKLGSRTVLLCAIALFTVFVLKWISVKQYMVWGALAFAAIFVFLQIWLEKYDDIVMFSKSIASGREKMFREFISELVANPIDYFFGSILKHRMNNYHNGPISIVMNIGWLGYLGYLLFWSSEIKEMNSKESNSAVNRLAIFMLLIYFIHSSAEAALTLGRVPYGVEVVIVSRIAKDKFD